MTQPNTQPTQMTPAEIAKLIEVLQAQQAQQTQQPDNILTTTMGNANLLLHTTIGVAEGLTRGLFGIARIAANLATLKKTPQ